MVIFLLSGDRSPTAEPSDETRRHAAAPGQPRPQLVRRVDVSADEHFFAELDLREPVRELRGRGEELLLRERGVTLIWMYSSMSLVVMPLEFSKSLTRKSM